MNNIRDYYAVLGVPLEADTDSIKSAYHAAARRFHPDVNAHPGASRLFQDIAQAYEILSDRSRRTEYDQLVRVKGLPPQYFEVDIVPSKRVLRAILEPQVLYVLVEIRANPLLASETPDEVPLNLALVVDRSTSMKGPRLDKVKQAAHRIIDSLGPDDRLSLVSFSDRAELVFASTPVVEAPTLKAMVSTMHASGGTEIFRGMETGAAEVRRSFDQRYVNHIILLTDGRTYGDEVLCRNLAQELSQEGIGISAIGIGEEWNDTFLDELASRTGGASTYVNSPAAVESFLNKQVRSLGAAFAERLTLSVAPDADVSLEDAFKLLPNAQPLVIDGSTIQLGSLERTKHITIILQLQIPPHDQEISRGILRLAVTGDMLLHNFHGFQVCKDLSIETSFTGIQENPPASILEALGKLTLYRMQSKAHEALARGDVREATRHLENLATRLLENGEDALAHAALAEARRVARTTLISDEGQKRLKYGTRMLLSSQAEAGSIE